LITWRVSSKVVGRTIIEMTNQSGELPCKLFLLYAKSHFISLWLVNTTRTMIIKNLSQRSMELKREILINKNEEETRSSSGSEVSFKDTLSDSEDEWSDSK
jgi:hypothetical protein